MSQKKRRRKIKDDQRPNSKSDLSSMFKMDLTENYLICKTQVNRNLLISRVVENYDSRDTRWFGEDLTLYSGVSTLEKSLCKKSYKANSHEYRVKYFHEDT